MTSTLQFQTVSNQVSVPSTHPKFSRNTKAQHETSWFGRSDHDKQNKLSCFIDRYGEKLLKGHDLGKILRLANQKQ
jgi:hypothetical protein